MSLFNLPVEHKAKPPEPIHPWTRTIKEHYANKVKRAHNSVREVCRNPKQKTPCQKRVTFTVIGNRVTKEFIYCVNLVQGMHKYRWKTYDTPIIKGCTGVEWADHLQEIKIKYGSLACAIQSQVIVLCDNEFIGGEKELKDLIESKYIYHLALNYRKESVKNFAYYLKTSRRPCAYMHISINGEPIGSLIFMLYSDMVPRTCENFLRLCKTRQGGYSGTPIHRVVKDGWIQGGGFGLKNTNMDCENFIVPHDKRGVLGMANAGRHIDCSTQFYVLLQPNNWLTTYHRFVAFGQLIDGEETLKKIEEVETYYEAPTANVVIYSSGIVNLDCHDIIINKGVIPYLDGHIEDLVTIGELFYEMLMERVFIQIEFKNIQKLEPLGADDEKHSEIFSNEQLGADNGKHSEVLSNEEKSLSRHDSDTNERNDFDVDIYEYEAETSSTRVRPWSQAVAGPKGTRPYYIALTDVPYPGEVDSNFDLKRFLQGDYCLEADLDLKVCKENRDKSHHEDRIRVVSNLINNEFKQMEDLEMEMSSEGSSIHSDEIREIQDYLSTFGDRVSFSGDTVKSVADKVFRTNPLESKAPYEKFSDEDIRIMRSVLQQLKTKKKVTISAQERAPSNKIIRRPTGYLRPKDLFKFRERYRDVHKDKEEQEEHNEEINPVITERCVNIERVQNDFHGNRKMVIVGQSNTYQSTVRISPQLPTKFVSLDAGRTSNVSKKISLPEYETKRASVLERLFEDVTVKDDETLPTLKDYKPLMEIKNKTHSSMLMKDSTALLLRQSMENKTLIRQSMEDKAFIHQSMEENKLGDMRVGEKHPIIRAREHAKQRKQARPSISISQYRKMNEDKREEVKRIEKVKTEKKIMEHEIEDLKLNKGSLRLPGDTPLYSPVSLSITTEYQLELQRSLLQYENKDH